MPKRSPIWQIDRRRYTGVEDSFITPGCRKVTTKHGFVILIEDGNNVLYAEIALGGKIWRGRRFRGYVDENPHNGTRYVDWAKQGKSFIRGVQQYERDRDRS